MYPGGGPAVQAQVPGGQVASWDSSMQAIRPSYGSVPTTFPSQTYAAPPMPTYAPAAMPAASSPLAQASPVAHSANSMGFPQPGVPPNANLQPNGSSPPGPGSSPLMRTSAVAQGFVQPGAPQNVRPGGVFPPGHQPYYC